MGLWCRSVEPESLFCFSILWVKEMSKFSNILINWFLSSFSLSLSSHMSKLCTARFGFGVDSRLKCYYHLAPGYCLFEDANKRVWKIQRAMEDTYRGYMEWCIWWFGDLSFVDLKSCNSGTMSDLVIWN